MTWPEPPSSFLSGSSVDKYLLIGGKVPTKIFTLTWLPLPEREKYIDGLLARTNYTGKIIAILRDGRRGSTDWISFQTKEGSKLRSFFLKCYHISMSLRNFGIRIHDRVSFEF